LKKKIVKQIDKRKAIKMIKYI